jgi:multidrug efflux pump
MIGVTVFGIFLTPIFYYVVRWFSDRKPAEPAPTPAGVRVVGPTQ